ncbi:hypothetical protein [Mailhella massiliensis]|uniref:hypothetical protein n=1 Tax=Mailhella massiliensis TaxID=1903261 RepID=UPI001185FF0C|nr:hypothetical protein [Mailhella massiliensis]
MISERRRRGKRPFFPQASHGFSAWGDGSCAKKQQNGEGTPVVCFFAQAEKMICFHGLGKNVAKMHQYVTGT